jgi:hypothetical protein
MDMERVEDPLTRPLRGHTLPQGERVSGRCEGIPSPLRGRGAGVRGGFSPSLANSRKLGALSC